MKLFNLAFNVVSKTSIYSKVKFRKLVLKKNSTHRLSRPSQNQNLFVKYNFSSKLVSRSGSSRTIRKRRSAIFSIRKQKLFFLKKRSQFYLKTKFNKLFSSKRKNKFNARFFSKNSYSSVLSNTLHKNKSNWFTFKINKLSKNSTLRDNSALFLAFDRARLKSKKIFPVVKLSNFIRFFFIISSFFNLAYLYKFFFFINPRCASLFSFFKIFFSPFASTYRRNLVLINQSPFFTISRLLFFYFNNLFLLQNWTFLTSFLPKIAKRYTREKNVFTKFPSFLSFDRFNHPRHVFNSSVIQTISARATHTEVLGFNLQSSLAKPLMPFPLMLKPEFNFFYNFSIFFKKSFYWIFLEKKKYSNIKIFILKNLRVSRKIRSMFGRYGCFGVFSLFIKDVNFANLKKTKPSVFFLKRSDTNSSGLTKITRYSEQLPVNYSLSINPFLKKNYTNLFKSDLSSHLSAFSPQVALSRLYAENDSWVESNFFFFLKKINKLQKRTEKYLQTRSFFYKLLYSSLRNLISKRLKSILFLPNAYSHSDKNFLLTKINHNSNRKNTFSFNFSNSFTQFSNSRALRSGTWTNLKKLKIANVRNYFFSLSKPEFLFLLTSSPLFFRYFLYKNHIFKKNIFFNFSNFFLDKLSSSITRSFFYANHIESDLRMSNLVPTVNFKFFLKKYIIKTFTYSKFSSSTASWQYLTIIKFLEFCSGKKVYINFFTFLTKLLSPIENARCELWSQRLRSFKKAFGAKLFVTESLQIVYTALKLKDPYFLSNWLLGMFYKISFWKLKLVIRYLQYILRYFFQPYFKEIAIKGLKVQIKGKVSVAGNARTRTVMYKIGRSSHATFDNKVLYNLNLIRTFTGVIGFKTWFTF